MEKKICFIIKITALIIFNTIFYNSFSQTKFPYDSLRKVRYIINPNYYEDIDVEHEIKPLEQERIENSAEKIYKRTFPANKKFHLILGDKPSYTLEAVYPAQYVIGVMKDSIPYIRLLLFRKSQNANPNFITSDNLIQKIESAEDHQTLSIVFETIPYGYKTKSTFFRSVGSEAIEIYAKILSVQIE
jgi:hypothetical protein